MNLNNNPERIVELKDRVVAAAGEIQDNANHVELILSYSNPFKKFVADHNGFVYEIRGELRGMDVQVDPIGMREPGFLVPSFFVKVNAHPRRINHRPVADSIDEGRSPGRSGGSNGTLISLRPDFL